MSMTTTHSAIDHRDEFARLRRAGFSYRAIGERYGISHERVRQVLVADGDARDWARVPARIQRKAQRDEIAAWLDEHGPISREEVLAHFGLTPQQLTQLIAEGMPSHRILMAGRATEVQFSDETIAEALRRGWAEITRLNPKASGMSHVLYERVRRMDDPSAALIVARHGWENACHAAGVPAGTAWRPKASYVSRWSDDAILDAVATYVEWCRSEGVRPSYLRMERYQQEREGVPSGTLVRNRMRAIGLKTWPEIIVAAAERTRKSA